MAGQTSKENGKKGGRPKGSKAAHTINAEQGKALLVKMYLDNIRPINEALLKKAREGDMQAIKELHDRVYNKATQPLEGKVDSNVVIEIIKYGDKNKTAS